MNYLIALLNRVVRLIRPDVDAIIASFLKAQSKLEALIARETAALEAEAKAEAAILAARLLRNTTINRAYRVIHRLDELTA